MQSVEGVVVLSGRRSSDGNDSESLLVGTAGDKGIYMYVCIYSFYTLS